MKNYKGICLVAALSVAGLTMSACATEEYVDQKVAVVDTKVDGVSAHVDQIGSQLQALSGRVDGVDRTAQDALQRANAAGTMAAGKFQYTVVSQDDSIKFDTNKSALSDEAKATLTAFAERLKADNKNVFVEIQGHGDHRGWEVFNLRLGLLRAEAVRRFLNQQGIALNRMSTISYGEELPAADNSTAQGQSLNRRVVLVVMS